MPRCEGSNSRSTVPPEWHRPATGFRNWTATPKRSRAAASHSLFRLHKFHEIQVWKEQESNTTSRKGDSRCNRTSRNRPPFQSQPHFFIEVFHFITEVV